MLSVQKILLHCVVNRERIRNRRQQKQQQPKGKNKAFLFLFRYKNESIKFIGQFLACIFHAHATQCCESRRHFWRDIACISMHRREIWTNAEIQ